MLGFGVVVLAALVFWFMPQTENPLTPKPEDAAVDDAVPAVTVRDIPAELPVAVDKAPVKDAPPTEPVSHAAIDLPAQQSMAADNSPVVDKPQATRVTAVRSFQDELAGGGSGPLMVKLPAASYLMGSAGNSLNFEERPQHPVDLPAYAIGKYEVSFAEYDRFAQATGRHLPYDEGWGRGDRPAINVSWKDAVAYTRWLSKQTAHKYRLPSESKWEFAARAGTTTAFWWDGKTDGSPANCFDCGSRWDGTSTAPVGSFPANSFGLYDTAGNVQEWTEDCYHSDYQDAPSDGSTWQAPRCTQRVVRGGSYTSPLESVRSARRGQYDQDTRLDNLGFRVVRVK
jgi:formylglycine-generating enzyme required for sulfatase activity